MTAEELYEEANKEGHFICVITKEEFEEHFNRTIDIDDFRYAARKVDNYGDIYSLAMNAFETVCEEWEI